MKLRIKRHGMILAVFTIVFIFLYNKVLPKWESKFFDGLLDVLGIISILLGFWLRLSARGYKSEKSKVGHNLVVDGPFSLVRNPMYLGVFLIGLGIVLGAWRWWVIFLFIAFFLLTYIPEIKKEEELLSQTFGQVYKDYYQKVPALLPKISLFFTRNIKELLPLKFIWIRWEIFSIIFVLLLVFFYDLYGNILSFGKEIILTQSVIFFLTITVFSLFIFCLYSNNNRK